MKTGVCSCITTLLLGITLSAIGYELETHANLTDAAARQSVLNSAIALRNLGLRFPIDNAAQAFPNSNGSAATLMELLKDGARFEDNGLRPLSHFFNPLTGSGLFGLTPSPDWALAERGAFAGALTSQSNSYQDARQQLYEAITDADIASRHKKFGLMFQSLGQVIHHLQDMAQPQHVRDDPHLALPLQYEALLCVSLPELCGAILRVQNPSAYERFTEEFRERIFPVASYGPVYSTSDTTTFTAPRKFWINSGKGMAEYTNKGFVSDGTNFRGLPGPIETDVRFPDPNGSTASIDVVKADDLRLLLNCPGGPLSTMIQDDDEMWFVSTHVADEYTGNSDTNTKTSSYSIFDSDLQRRGKSKTYTLNRYTFCVAQSLLLPRAVGYSAGLLNYFFRGNMAITLPDDGIYSIVDHSPSGCGKPCGFHTLKLKLRNKTPGAEVMGIGKLLSVVKFHLNTCYQPDLSGDDGGTNFKGTSCRSAEEYITASASRLVTGVSLDQEQQFTFDFSAQPIPINASDVFLQVVFRGQLGMETDAVAVATKDISEPTYYGLENVTDYAYDENGDQKYHAVASSSSMVDVTDVHIAFGPNADKVDPVASLALLGGGEHAQIAVLMDTGPQQASISLSGQFGQAPAVVQFDPAEFTQDDDGPAAGLYKRNCDLILRRGLYRERGVLFVQRTHGVFGGIHTLDNQTSSMMTPEPPVTSERHGARAESVRDPRCTHLTTGMYDLSSMTPFVPEAAQSWTIRF